MKIWKLLAVSVLVLSNSTNAALINESFTTTVLQEDFIGTVGSGTFMKEGCGLLR